MAMTLSEIVYTPLVDAPKGTEGWEKQTIEYAMKHKTRIKQSIKYNARMKNKTLQQSDIDDCYTDLIMYLYRSSDYDLSVATERAGDKMDKIISLESFVFSSVRYITLRYVTDMITTEMNETSDIVKNDSEEDVSLFEIVADKKDAGYESIFYDLDTLCKYYESCRYKYNIDIFEMWFIKLLTIKYNKKDTYTDILTILGVKHTDIVNMERKTNHSGVMLDIAKAISVCGMDKAIEIIRNYTYSADKIEKVIQLF